MSGDFLETSRPLLAWVGRTTWEASLIAALVLAAQWLLRGRVSARWRYNLWLLVVARLVLPTVPGSRVSPFNLVQLPTTAVGQRAEPSRVETPPRVPGGATAPRQLPAPVPGAGPARYPSKTLQFVSAPRRLVEPRLSGGGAPVGGRDPFALAASVSPREMRSD